MQLEGAMNKQDAGLTGTIAAIEAACGLRWGVWLSDTGWWWATRNRTLTAEQLSAGCAQHLQAHSPGELAERIRQQDSITPVANPAHDPQEGRQPC
jgi:hypothetical protein